MLLFPKSSFAIYDPLSTQNNKYGIHILFPEEISEAAHLVNSSGGEWGYVTIPIRISDRNIEKWQKFLDDSANYKVIPLPGQGKTRHLVIFLINQSDGF